MLNFSRRQLMHVGLSSLAGFYGLTATSSVQALPAKTLVFPRDRGAHPDFKTEWWYITGQASSGQRQFGFQLTFFSARVDGTAAMKSKFAAQQLLFAHAAISDIDGKKIWHDQRIARAGFGIASASQTDMAVLLRDWSLIAEGGRYTANLPATGFGLALEFNETQPMLLQGNRGLSRKGPDERQASYYYSQPQLAASGTLQLQGKNFTVKGKAWLDHEWSEEVLAPTAVGWDWIGMNLDDGSALTAFRLRDKDGGTVWDGGSFRAANQELRIFKRGEVVFTALSTWRSPLSQITYPVQWQIKTPNANYTVRALIDAQELDSRQSTGSIYWEGLSELLDAKGQRLGLGYLEMTGYGQALQM
jgi:predicted secreted hydrolase